MRELLLKNGQIYTETQVIDGDILMADGKISAIGDLHRDCETVDLNGKKVVPGFIDIHTHGGDHIDVNAAAAQDLHTLGRFFARNGTTAWLCSVLTDTREQTLWCIGQAKEAMAAPIDGAQLLGIHLEGPFLSKEYKGAMPECLLQKGSIELFRAYQKAAGGAIRYMTVAPETEGAIDLIREISNEIVIGLGHSNADYETAIAAIDAGAKNITHTFNAMRLFHQHEPAIMGAAPERDVYCETICDGRHLHPGTVRMLLSCKGYDRVIAVTDSVQAAGLPDGHYRLGVNDIVVEDGDAKLADTGVRAGSTLTTGQALRNLVKFTGEPLDRILPLLTRNPATLLGMYDRKGSLAEGKDADIVILDDELEVDSTYVSGIRVFTR